MKHWLWRAVVHAAAVLDVLAQSRPDKRAAKCLPRKLLKRRCRAPRVMVTDKLPSYGAAKRELMPSVEHCQHKGLNNRAEDSHRSTRRRERQTRRCNSPRQAQRFLSAHGQIGDLFHLRRAHVTAVECRAARMRAFETWAGVSGVAPLAAWSSPHFLPHAASASRSKQRDRAHPEMVRPPQRSRAVSGRRLSALGVEAVAPAMVSSRRVLDGSGSIFWRRR